MKEDYMRQEKKRLNIIDPWTRLARIAPNFEPDFDVCPVCERHDGGFDFRKMNFFLCKRHRLTWCDGDQMTSFWPDMLPDQREDVKKILNEYDYMDDPVGQSLSRKDPVRFPSASLAHFKQLSSSIATSLQVMTRSEARSAALSACSNDERLVLTGDALWVASFSCASRLEVRMRKQRIPVRILPALRGTPPNHRDDRWVAVPVWGTAALDIVREAESELLRVLHLLEAPKLSLAMRACMRSIQLEASRFLLRLSSGKRAPRAAFVGLRRRIGQALVADRLDPIPGKRKSFPVLPDWEPDPKQQEALRVKLLEFNDNGDWGFIRTLHYAEVYQTAEKQFLKALRYLERSREAFEQSWKALEAKPTLYKSMRAAIFQRKVARAGLRDLREAIREDDGVRNAKAHALQATYRLNSLLDQVTSDDLFKDACVLSALAYDGSVPSEDSHM